MQTDKESISTSVAESTYKRFQYKYESYESLIKQGKNPTRHCIEKNQEYLGILNDLKYDLQEIYRGQTQDPQVIQLMCNQVLPKFAKLLISRRYIPMEQETQIRVTEFFNHWLMMRVPTLMEEFAFDRSQAQRDHTYSYGIINKELEVLELILDDNQEFYNHRISRNSVETEEKLSKVMEQFNNLTLATQMEDDSNDFTPFQQFNWEVAYVKKQYQTSYFYVHNVNIFSKYGGFDLLLRILANGSKEGQHKITFKQYLGILNALTIMRGYLRDNFWLEYAPQVKDLCFDFIKKRCTQEDFRNLTKKDLTYFVGHLESLLDSVVTDNEQKAEQVYYYSENLELELALRCLKLPILEKKMIGNQIILQKIFQAKNNTNQPQTTQANNKTINLNFNKRWLNVERLIEWMEQHQIFDLVFGESLHSEVITKSNILLLFLYQNGKIGKKEIDKMWECATKKHEAYKVAILKTFQFLASKANREDLHYLFLKIKSLPMNELDKFCINLLKQIAKKLAGDEERVDEGMQSTKPTNLARSNSFSKGGSKFRPDLRINTGQEGKSKFARDENTKWVDDMSQPLGTQQKIKAKKTRSLSMGEDDGKSNNFGVFADNIGPMAISKQKKNMEEEKIQPQRTQERGLQETNPLEVPADKEDKKTADEEGSFGARDDADLLFNDANADMFDQVRDYPPAHTNIPAMNVQLAHQQKQNQLRDSPDLEEEKAQPPGQGTQEAITDNLREMINDQTLGIDNAEVRELANQVLDFMWQLCQEETVTIQHLSTQTHKLCIDQFVQLLTHSYPKAVLPYMARCVNLLSSNFSEISAQMILHKFLLTIQFPLSGSGALPKNRVEFIQYADELLQISNACLGSYIEFKQTSLTLIFNQIGSQEQEQENLETQSSLDNDDERSSIQSAQKNSQQNQQPLSAGNNITIQEFGQVKERQIEDVTQQSSGSLFVSPRGRMEEEFKMVPQKTQSYQSDQIHGFGRGSDFQLGMRDSNEASEEWFSKQNNQQLIMAPHGSASRHFNTQTKKNSSQVNSLQRAESTQIGPQTRQEAQRENTAETATQNQQQQSHSNREFLNNLITNEVFKYSYHQEMQFRLDFLKFYFGSSPSILKPQQIQIVWECLVNNAFFEKERDHFFNWCTQILKAAQNLPGAKDLDQIGGASIFKDDCMEMLFFDTLLKLDFRYITETMYECFERYFVYINEQYGQIVTNSAFESAFEVFETKLIGVEALWEITLCVRNDKVYTKAAEFLHRLYKKMSPTLAEKLNEIKEDLLQTCMDHIKTGLNEIRNEAGQDLYEVPIYQLGTSIEDPKNRIARSISQLCKFIDEFEGLRERGAKSQLGGADQEIKVICNNQINSSQGPKKVELTLPLSTKIGAIREQVAKSIFPPKIPKEICLTYKGKDLNEDLKSLKDLGVNSENQQIIMIVSMRNQMELDQQDKMEDIVYNQEEVNSMAAQLKDIFGFELPEEVLRLAVKKCNLNMEEAALILTDEEKVNDLQLELRKQEENNNIVMIDEKQEDEEAKQEESKLNLIISNRSECFEMLFELLNLGINEITNASWNLLIQIPVNKQLLNNIRTLSIVQNGLSGNWCQIIDPTNVYKLLYSLQIVNSLITVNNEKLSEAEIQERFEWRARFLELGGFDHLYSILITSDIDELLGFAQQQIAQTQSTKQSKKKRTGQQRNKAYPSPSTELQQKEQHQIQNNSAKCLGYLISIIKIFIQAALLTSDEEKIFTLIVQSSTSPFRKLKAMGQLSQVNPSKLNQMILKGSGQSVQEDTSLNEGISRDNSSVNTPKFHSSHSSIGGTPQCNTPGEILPRQKDTQNKSDDNLKAETFSQQTFSKPNESNQLYTQIDDFPRLVEQMSGYIAQNLLEKVVNFNGLISKLLLVIYKATMFCDSSEVAQLVQNSLDLLLPCVVWKPNQLLKEIYEFEHLESLIIRTLMYSSNENVRKSLEKTFKIICSDGIISSTNKNDAKTGEGSAEGSKAQAQFESPKLYILKMLLNNMPDVNQKSDQCEEYFNLLTSLIRQCQSNFKFLPKVGHSGSINSQNYKQRIILPEGMFSSIDLLEWCIYQLQSRPTYEDRYSSYTDKVLGGYLQLTQSILEIDHDLKMLTTKQSDGYNLVKIIFDFLFLLPSMEDQQQKHLRANDKNLSPKQAIQEQAQPNSIDAHPKCKQKFTRKKAFNLLLTLCHLCKENYVQLLQELYVFQSQIQKSQKVVNLAEFDNEVGMRSSTGYVGLKNFACTCYMNSLIQQLFMIPDLRKGILQSEITDPDHENNVLYQLKMIFANLQESEKQYYSPLGFTKAFKFYGEPVNVRIQQDTHEFFNILCDNIENSLRDSRFTDLLKDTIGGQIVNEVKSLEKDYPFVGEREEDFFAISLDIKNKKNLAEALDLYIKPDYLEGDNKYHCEKYDAKINAQRRSYLKKLSNTVIINLKRFEFDYTTMQKNKVNDYCEFPTRINFKPWTKEGIRERDRLLSQNSAGNNAESPNERVEENQPVEEVDDNEMEAEEQSLGDSDEKEKKGGEALDEDMESNEDDNDQNINTGTYFDDGMEDMIDIEDDQVQKKSQPKDQSEPSQKDPSLPQEDKSQLKLKKQKKSIENKDDQYYEYELVGILVHSGSADSGHYYSFIKERGTQRWLEFNDKIVREFDIKNLEQECFGGNNDNRSNLPAPGLLDDFNPADGRFFERCRNAYLLFYERVQKTSKKEYSDQEISINQRLINGIDSSMYQRIWDENAAFMKLKIFFDQEYFQFVREYVNLYNFENVPQFSPEHSESKKIKQMVQLSEKYDQEDWEQLTIEYKLKQLEIERNAAQFDDNDIFQNIQDVSSDPGLYTIKLATILSQDIITKVKDVQSFVSWMQLMNQLYERHAVACVWFIKYLTGNRKLIEELLLETMSFEVRESFSNLLNTAISVTAKNEESYFFQVISNQQYLQYDTYYDFDCDLQHIQQRKVDSLKQSKASVIRLMDVLFNQMLDTVRVHWRRFDEYFMVLLQFTQLGFPETKYLIENNAIVKLLEFAMNCQSPFFSTTKYKMSDRMQSPNFTLVVDMISILVRSCVTQGIKNVNQYSAQSKYQSEYQHIALPYTEIQYFLTSNCFTSELLPKAPSNNDSLKNMVEYLCWGDFENSKFFLHEILENMKMKKYSINDIVNHQKILGAILLIKDELQDARLRFAFNFDNFQTKLGIMAFLDGQKKQYALYALKILQFIGDLASKDAVILNFMRNNQGEWVSQFLLGVKNQAAAHHEAKASSINLKLLVESAITSYSLIFDNDELLQSAQAVRGSEQMQDDSFDGRQNQDVVNTDLNREYDFGEGQTQDPPIQTKDANAIFDESFQDDNEDKQLLDILEDSSSKVIDKTNTNLFNGDVEPWDVNEQDDRI